MGGGAAASYVDVRRLRYQLNRSAQSKHPRGAITGADTDPRDLRGGTGGRHRRSAPHGVRDAGDECSGPGTPETRFRVRDAWDEGPGPGIAWVGV